MEGNSVRPLDQPETAAEDKILKAWSPSLEFRWPTEQKKFRNFASFYKIFKHFLALFKNVIRYPNEPFLDLKIILYKVKIFIKAHQQLKLYHCQFVFEKNW